jgi:large subunit ribosomal protein L4
MEIYVRTISGDQIGTMDLDDRVFGIEPNRAVLHQAVVAQLANRRQGTHETKTRALVAGGGRKPWRQKGTGRARQGSIRSPHYKGGGIVFGPHPRDYHQDLPRKMRRLALRSALSDKAASGNLHIVDRFELSEIRTKALLSTLQTLGLSGKTIIVLPSPDETVRRASGNLEDVWVALPNGINVVDLLNADAVVIGQEAVGEITRLLLGEAAEQEGAAA